MLHLTLFSTLIFSLPQLNKKYPFWIFSLFCLFLFMSLRYNYGNDYMNYYNAHTLINEGSWAWGNNNILYRILNNTFSNFFVMVTVISIFYLVTIGSLIKFNLSSKYYWLALLILLINPYLFLVQLSSIRQTISICFFIISSFFIIKKQFIPYIICILLALGMHSSAIVLLPIYFIIGEKKITKKYVLYLLVILGILLFTPIFDLIVVNILKYLPEHYLSYYKENLTNSISSAILSGIYLLFILFNLNKLEGKEMVYGKLSLIATILSLLAIKLSMITRIGMYFDIFLIITIPQILSKMDNKLLKFLWVILLFSIYILRYYSFFNNPLWESFRHYQSLLWR